MDSLYQEQAQAQAVLHRPTTPAMLGARGRVDVLAGQPRPQSRVLQSLAVDPALLRSQPSCWRCRRAGARREGRIATRFLSRSMSLRRPDCAPSRPWTGFYPCLVIPQSSCMDQSRVVRRRLNIIKRISGPEEEVHERRQRKAGALSLPRYTNWAWPAPMTSQANALTHPI